jgi:hypothetical protein
MAYDSVQKQTSLEERIYPIDFSPALLSGVTLTSVAFTHTVPSGSTSTSMSTGMGSTVTTPIAYVKMPSGLPVGRNFVNVVATTSNADLSPEVRLVIQVDY